MSALTYGRTSHSPPHVRRSATARAARSAPGVSHHKTASKPHRARKHRKEKDEDTEEEELDFGDDDDMTTSFLQYCTMCEKQILVPNSSFLYCSEHCRRMDALPSSQKPNGLLPLSTSYKLKERYPTILDPLGHSLPRYVPKTQPTPDPRIPPKIHAARRDLDPTEWKPAEPGNSDDDDHGPLKDEAPPGKRPLLPRKSIEALQYRSKYRVSAPVGKLTTSGGVPAMPSLSHASTVTDSSYSSNASSLETPYTLVTPPPAPTMSITNASSLGIAGLSIQDREQSNFKKMALGSEKRKSAASGSLKKLLGGEVR